MNEEQTRFPIAGTNAYVAELSHLGYPAGQLAATVRTTDGHGPLRATGEVHGGRTYVVCPSESCGARMFFSNIEPLTSVEKRIELEQRNAALSQAISRHMGKVTAGQMVRERALQLTQNERSEYDLNAAEIARLKALGNSAPVGVKFKDVRSGGIVARLIEVPQAVSQEVPRIVFRAADDAPNPPTRDQKRYAEQCKDCSFVTEAKTKKLARAYLKGHRNRRHPVSERVAVPA